MDISSPGLSRAAAVWGTVAISVIFGTAEASAKTGGVTQDHAQGEDAVMAAPLTLGAVRHAYGPAPADDPADIAADDPVAEGPTRDGGDPGEPAEVDLPGEEDDAEDPTAAPAEETPPSRDHFKTVGIAIAPGFGYAMTLAGDKFCGQFSDASDDSDGRKSVCTDLTPVYLDISLSYGVTPQVDLVLGGRINLQRRGFDDASCEEDDPFCADAAGLFLNRIGGGIFPGVRIWGKGSDRLVKFGAGVDFMVMFENFDGYRDRPRSPREESPGTEGFEVSEANEDAVGDVSLGLRAGPVLAIDPHHNVGFYIFPALSPSFRPAKSRDADAGWLEIAVDFSAGIQARFP